MLCIHRCDISTIFIYVTEIKKKIWHCCLRHSLRLLGTLWFWKYCWNKNFPIIFDKLIKAALQRVIIASAGYVYERCVDLLFYFTMLFAILVSAKYLLSNCKIARQEIRGFFFIRIYYSTAFNVDIMSVSRYLLSDIRWQIPETTRWTTSANKNYYCYLTFLDRECFTAHGEEITVRGCLRTCDNFLD